MASFSSKFSRFSAMASDRMQWVGASLATLALGGFLAMTMGFYPDWMLYVLALYPIGLMIIALGDGISIGFHPLGIIAIFVLRLVLSLWDLLSIVAYLPFLALHMIMGPMMVVMFFVCTVMVGVDIIEWLGIDLEGTSGTDNLQQFLFVLAGAVISGGTIYWMFLRDDAEGDAVLDYGADLIHKVPDWLLAGIASIKRHYGAGQAEHRDISST